MILIYKIVSINDFKKRLNVIFVAGNLKELGFDVGGFIREFMYLVMIVLFE